MKSFTFQYGVYASATVTVRAEDESKGRVKAAAELDRRYEKAGKEAPVSWSLRLVSKKGRNHHA